LDNMREEWPKKEEDEDKQQSGASSKEVEECS
jgi:hypothetical protein